MATETTLTFSDADKLIEFLKSLGAEKVRHSKRTFLEHLVGTAAILQRWGAGERACKAGLFHSIYGTQYFKGAIIGFDERTKIRGLLGDAPEELAYVFCAFDRASTFRAIDAGPPYRVTRRGSKDTFDLTEGDLRDLVLLLWANEIEQAEETGRSPEGRLRQRQQLAKSVPFLPEVALRELEAVYGPTRTKHGDPMPEPGLRSLLNLETTTEAFLAKYWPEQMYVARGAVERLAGLVDHDFDALVRMKKHHAKAFFRGVDGTSQSIILEPGQEKPLYDAGFTIYFHNLSSPALAEWVNTLDGELGLVHGHTRVAAFASRKGLGLKPHYDQNDNFVCQAKGTKRWRIWPNTSVKHPTLGYTIGGKLTAVHEVEAPEGFPKEMTGAPEVVDMEPGTVMFMPRGMWHDTETATSESLHFNVQSGLAMWKAALEYVLTRTSALHREDLREPIVGLFEGETTRATFADELKERLRSVVDEICESEIELSRQPFYKFITSRRPRG